MWGDEGKLDPIALQIDDLSCAERGWSVQRTECTSLALAHEVAAQLSQVDAATATVATAAVADIRKIQTEAGEQGLFVLENFLSGNPAHALVFANAAVKGTGRLRRLRALLTDVLARRGPLSEVFRPD